MTYAPWVEERRAGFVFIGAAAASAAGAWLALRQGYVAWAAMAVLALVFFGLGLARLKSARHREFGKSFEQEAVSRAIPVLTQLSLSAHANHAIAYGDIDLLVRGCRGAVPVEVKSFVQWKRHWILSGARETKAIHQVGKQCSSVKAAIGVIWLPQGRPSFLQRLLPSLAGAQGVQVVFGDERKLANAARRLVG